MRDRCCGLERVAGIEPASSAWKAEVLPLNYTRRYLLFRTAPPTGPSSSSFATANLVEGEGFEPSKAKPSDLQSGPFDHSGTPPEFFNRYLSLAPVSICLVPLQNRYPFASCSRLAALKSEAKKPTSANFAHQRGGYISFSSNHLRCLYCYSAMSLVVPFRPVLSARSTWPSQRAESGAATRSRTLDLLITSELLYQLSYGGRNGSRIL